MNERIRVREIRLIDENGGQVGVVPPHEALKMARERGLDLVEISPTAQPPVCKIMDYGKFLFEKKKKESEAKKKQKIIVVKEVQFRPRIDEHDFDFKRNNVVRFLQHGDKVKATVQFRGREMMHRDLAMARMREIVDSLSDIAKVETPPRTMGRRTSLIIAPDRAKVDAVRRKQERDQKAAGAAPGNGALPRTDEESPRTSAPVAAEN